MSRPACCCKDTSDPGPWTAGVDDSADPEMVAKMHRVRERLSHQMSTDELIWMMRASAGLDQRTRLGYHIQCCVLHNAASRMELLAMSKDPMPWRAWLGRIGDAWDVVRGRGVLVRTSPVSNGQLGGE